MTPESTIDRAVLERAAGLLQAAHDHIEQFGFDIETYDDFVNPSAPRCWIGTMWYVAGADTARLTTLVDAGDGDGPELRVALEHLDEIAKIRIARLSQYAGAENYIEEDPDATNVGRFIEYLGFMIQARARDRFSVDYEECQECQECRKYQKAYALRLLRQALTTIYR